MAIAQQFEGGLLCEVAMHHVALVTLTDLPGTDRCAIEFSDGHQKLTPFVDYSFAKTLRDQLLTQFPVPEATFDPVLFMLQLKPPARAKLRDAIADFEAREDAREAGH